MTDKLDIYIGRLQHLPAAPTVVVKLVALFRKHNLEVDEIVSLMSQDPSLTAEVLRSANSAYFGDDDQVVGVFEAIMRLGLYKVYQMAMANFGATVLSFSRNVGGIDVETLWRHSAAVASAAGLIARKVEEPEALAFTAGLLHDVGKIVLGAAEGTAYAALAREAVETGVPLQQAEAKRFGFGHAEVGARLLAKWGLPEEIAVPVRFHHEVGWPEPVERICAIVSLANFVAHAAAGHEEGKQNSSPEAAYAMSVLWSGDEDLALLLQEAQSEMSKLTGILGVKPASATAPAVVGARPAPALARVSS
jgi:putative nucleotidyltransferase with HDIG domain